MEQEKKAAYESAAQQYSTLYNFYLAHQEQLEEIYSDQPELLAEKLAELEQAKKVLEAGGIGVEGMEEIPKPLFERVIKNIFIEYTSEITNLVAEKKLKEVLTDTSQLEDLLNLFTEEEPIVAAVKQTLKTAIEAHNKKTLGTLNIQVALKQIDIKEYYERRKHRGKKLSESALRKIFPSSENVAKAFVRLADKTDPNHPDNLEAIEKLTDWIKSLKLQLFTRANEEITPLWKETRSKNLKLVLSGTFPNGFAKLEELFIVGLDSKILPTLLVYEYLYNNLLNIEAHKDKMELLGEHPEKLDKLPSPAIVLKEITNHDNVDPKNPLFSYYEQKIAEWYNEQVREVKSMERETMETQIDSGCLDPNSSEVVVANIPESWKTGLLTKIIEAAGNKAMPYHDLSSIVQTKLLAFKSTYNDYDRFKELKISSEKKLNDISFPINIKGWIWNCNVFAQKHRHDTVIQIKALLQAILKVVNEICAELIATFGSDHLININNFLAQLLAVLNTNISIENLLKLDSLFGGLDVDVKVGDFILKFEPHIKNIINNDNRIFNFYNQDIVIYNVSGPDFLKIVADLKVLTEVVIKLKRQVLPPVPPNPIKVQNFEHVDDTLQTKITFQFKDVTSFFAPSSILQRYSGIEKLPDLVKTYLNCVYGIGQCLYSILRRQKPGTKKVRDIDLKVEIPYKINKLASGESYATIENNTDIRVLSSGGGHYTMSGSGIKHSIQKDSTKITVPIVLTISLIDPILQKGDNVEISYIAGTGRSFTLCTGGESSSLEIRAELVTINNKEQSNLDIYLNYIAPLYKKNTFFKKRVRKIKINPFHKRRVVESIE